jgi:hypothetical protein
MSGKSIYEAVFKTIVRMRRSKKTAIFLKPSRGAAAAEEEDQRSRMVLGTLSFG